jgi:hypothetical protein
MYTCRTNYRNYQNKTFVGTEQIIWTSGKICIHDEQILKTAKTKKSLGTKQIIWTNTTNSRDRTNIYGRGKWIFKREQHICKETWITDY